MPANFRDHHIARHTKPGTPVVIEIHFKMSHGQSGRVFDLDKVWSQCVPVEFRGAKTSILSPTHRVLLNTVHAMLPDREYLTGDISVLQWTEFAYLANRYGRLIDWEYWYSIAEKNNFTNMFKIYYFFAIKYLHVPKKVSINLSGNYIKFNEKRLLFISQYQNKELHASLMSKLILSLFRLGHYVGLVKWLWDNQCYNENMTGFFERIQYCLKKLFSKDGSADYWLQK